MAEKKGKWADTETKIEPPKDDRCDLAKEYAPLPQAEKAKFVLGEAKPVTPEAEKPAEAATLRNGQPPEVIARVVKPVSEDDPDASWLPGDTVWYWGRAETKPKGMEPIPAVLLRRNTTVGKWEFNRQRRGGGVFGSATATDTPQIGHLTARDPEFLE